MQAKEPGNVREGVGIAAIEKVAVVHGQRGTIGVICGVGPLNDFLAPVHP